MVGMGDEIRPLVLQYVNRLSDWIFVLTRLFSIELERMKPFGRPKVNADYQARFIDSM